MTDRELKNFYHQVLLPQLKSIEKQRLQAVFHIFYATVCGCLIAVTFLLTHKLDLTATFCLPCTFILLGTGGYFVTSGYNKFSKYKTHFKKTIVKQIVKQFDPDWKYFHDRKIKTTDFDRSGLLRTTYSRINGDDLVVGQIEKTKFYSSELHIEKQVQTGKSSSYKTLFKGLFFFADFNKNINSETYLFQKSSNSFSKFLSNSIQSLFGTFNSGKGEYVTVENQELNELFDIYTTNQQEARYILTPHIIEAILSLNKKLRRPINLSFKENRVYISIHFGIDLFEPRLFSTNVNYSDIRFMKALFETNIILVRELNLNTRIWTKD